jgi:hypothetical protein
MDFMTVATSGRRVVFAYAGILPNQIIKNLHFCVKKETVKKLVLLRYPASIS